MAWEPTGVGLGRFYYPGTIRELSGNYPGFKAGWAGWTWLGLAGLVGLGWLVGPSWAGWAGLAGPRVISFTFSECGGTNNKTTKKRSLLFCIKHMFLMNLHDLMFFSRAPEIVDPSTKTKIKFTKKKMQNLIVAFTHKTN